MVLIVWSFFTTSCLSKIPVTDEIKNLDKFDTSGYRHGWFNVYLDEHFRTVKNPVKASYTMQTFYINGAPISPYLTKKVRYYKLIGGKATELISKRDRSFSPETLDGSYIAMNRRGKTNAMLEFKEGKPTGKFIVYDKNGNYIELMQFFEEDSVQKKLYYDIWFRQLGSGQFEHHYKLLERNNEWAYHRVVDSLENVSKHRLILFLDSRPKFSISNIELIANDSLRLKFNSDQYCELETDFDKIKLRDVITNEEIYFEFTDNLMTICIGYSNRKCQATIINNSLWPKLKEARGLKPRESKEWGQEKIPLEKEKRKKWR